MRNSPTHTASWQNEVAYPTRAVDFEEPIADRTWMGLYRADQNHGEFDLGRAPASFADHTEPGVTRLPPRESPKIITVIRDDNSMFGNRIAQDRFIQSPLQANLIDMHGIVAVRHAQCLGDTRRQVFVDQEARRHNLPLGRPRGGFARA